MNWYRKIVMIVDFIKENITLLTGLISAIFAYFGGKKMKAIEEKKANSEALSSISALYDKLVEQMDEKFTQMNAEMSDLRKQLNEYKQQCKHCSNNKL
jgi:flagellar capping protein FliD